MGDSEQAADVTMRISVRRARSLDRSLTTTSHRKLCNHDCIGVEGDDDESRERGAMGHSVQCRKRDSPRARQEVEVEDAATPASLSRAARVTFEFKGHVSGISSPSSISILNHQQQHTLYNSPPLRLLQAEVTTAARSSTLPCSSPRHLGTTTTTRLSSCRQHPRRRRRRQHCGSPSGSATVRRSRDRSVCAAPTVGARRAPRTP
jgi:hypothetical protein